MAYEPKPNTGSLFRNNNKERDVHPDYRGDVYIDKGLLNLLAKEHVTPSGLVKVSLSGWKSQTKDGQTYLSLRASEPYVPKGAPKARPADEDISQDEEDVPF